MSDKLDNYLEMFEVKPKLNLQWYKGTDQYSEGTIEDKVLQLIAENEPENYAKAVKEEFSWSTFYHLNVLRQNILNWYPFALNASVLEVGCGMGAITNMLCDRCGDVTAVELSKRRATAALLRCREKENLEIIVGNLNDIEFEKKYDYITLIGVFEYQGNYTKSDQPYQDFLRKIKSLLKPEGKLLIAIENQYGLKYWCGAREDHTGIPFDGMNQYAFSDKKVRTFSKKALEDMVKECGFSNTFYYYPMPDYKLPTVIYSQDYLPQNENMLNMSYYYIPDDKTLIADEKNLYHDIIENNVFEFFANSYLLECSEAGEVGEATFASISNRRQPEYQIATRFIRNKYVEKYALKKAEGKRHIDEIVKNGEELQNRGLKVWKAECVGDTIRSPFCREDTVEAELLRRCRQQDKDGMMTLLDELYRQILQSAEKADWESNILYTFYPQKERDEAKYGTILKKGYLDMILRNAFWSEKSFLWFDQEWTLENVPAIFVMYRALIELYVSYPELEKCIPITEQAIRYHLVETWADMRQLEQLFEGVIIDADHYSSSNRLARGSINICAENINKLINE